LLYIVILVVFRRTRFGECAKQFINFGIVIEATIFGKACVGSFRRCLIPLYIDPSWIIVLGMALSGLFMEQRLWRWRRRQ
jgi:hypothetical protein